MKNLTTRHKNKKSKLKPRYLKITHSLSAFCLKKKGLPQGVTVQKNLWVTELVSRVLYVKRSNHLSSL